LADDSPRWQPPRVVSISKGHRPVGIAGATEFEAWINQVEAEQGKQFGRGVAIFADRDGNLAFPRAVSDFFEAWYPDLYEGDILPLLGEIYRVQGMSGDPDARSASIQLLRLPNPESPAIPDGVQTLKGTYAFPFESGGRSRLHYVRFKVAFRSRGVGGPGEERPTITVSVPNHEVWVPIPRGKRLEKRPPRTQTVHVGDLLRIGDAWHRVRNIVPPDRENHVIGWFEIDQKPERMGDDGK
jgi:hypothetical protein